MNLASAIIEREQPAAEKEAEDKFKPKIHDEPIGQCVCGGTIVVQTLVQNYIQTERDEEDNVYRIITHSVGCFCSKCGICYNAEIVKKLSALREQMR
jgi:hypothetical protein